MTKESKAYLSTKEVANYLGVHPETLRRWVKGGKMYKPTKIGKDYKWELNDVKEFMKGN